jgi:hypothetical protein
MSRTIRLLVPATAAILLWANAGRLAAQDYILSYYPAPVVTYSAPVVTYPRAVVSYPSRAVVPAAYYTVPAAPVYVTRSVAVPVAPVAVSPVVGVTTTRYGVFGRPRYRTYSYSTPVYVLP